MGGAFLAGGAGAYTGSMKDHFGKVAYNEKIAGARERKKVIYDERSAALDAAIVIEAEALKTTPAISKEFAHLIRPQLTAKLGYDPGDTTIKKAVRRIREGNS